jgi:glucose/arabinose dehydrogenase
VVVGLGATTDLAFLPDGSMVITEKTGAVKLRRPDGSIATAGSFEVDTESEKGLLGVVADPAFAQNRRLFFYVSVADSAGGTDLDRNRVISVILSPDGTLDRTTDTTIVRDLRGPANHDGGALAIGPDGLLYIGVGDTGCNSGRPPSVEQPSNFFATCLTNGNGKILRVNLDGSIPADNPLASVAAVTACGNACGVEPTGTAPPRRDIWAWGFRNPWRFSFDPQTGALWVGDVGEVTFEEISIAQAGRHHGWPWREGGEGWPVTKCTETQPGGDCVDPAYYCRHAAAAGGIDGDCGSVTGGVIVESPTWPADARGRYYFADNVTSRIWSLELNTTRTGVVPGSRREVGRIEGGAPVSMRVGPDGDVYIAVLPLRVVKLAPAR